MEIIKSINYNLLDYKISSIEEIEDNIGLELIIRSIRGAVSYDCFENNEQIDAYYKASILIFDNLKSPYWRNSKKDEILFDDYFQEKMWVKFSNDKASVTTQLVSLWNQKKTSTINWNLSGLEVMVREAKMPIEKTVIRLIVDVLNPLILKAEQKLLLHQSVN